MPKRACIIITEDAELDVTSGWGYGRTAHYERVPTSEQLLADLRLLVEPYPDIDEWNSAATRVRALLPEEES